MSSIVDAPAPWNMDGEMYSIILGSQSALPDASYHALEQPDTSDPHDKTHKYLGGPGGVCIVRYKNVKGDVGMSLYTPCIVTQRDGNRSIR